ncbi:MAG: hypothetical protein KAG97_02855 [Victivallales bacterium]|nr:hypothetical protein [Victivallales bacterium]
MEKQKTNDGVDTRPIFDIRAVPLSSRFKSFKAMRIASIKAAIPDLIIAAVFLYSLIMFLDVKSTFKNSMEGMMILELIVLILFPFVFRVLATESKAEFRSTLKLRIITGWINVFNILFVIALMAELAYLTSKPEGREWIAIQIFILAGTKIYSVFFAEGRKVSPMEFSARMTVRLICGLVCGVFTCFFAIIILGFVISTQMLSEVSMLLVGYVYFITMGVFSLFKQDFFRILESKGPDDGDEEMIYELYYPRQENKK